MSHPMPRMSLDARAEAIASRADDRAWSNRKRIIARKNRRDLANARKRRWEGCRLMYRAAMRLIRTVEGLPRVR